MNFKVEEIKYTGTVILCNKLSMELFEKCCILKKDENL